MWQAIGKYVGGRVLTAILVIASAGCVIWFWRHPEQLQEIWRVAKLALAWIGFVLVLPWALFFLLAWVRKFENNVAPAIMLIGYLAVDVVAALYLAGWHVSGANRACGPFQKKADGCPGASRVHPSAAAKSVSSL